MKRLLRLTKFQLSEKVNIEPLSHFPSLLRIILLKTVMVAVWTVLIFALLDRLAVDVLSFSPEPALIGFFIGVVMFLSFLTSINSVITNLFYASDNGFLLSFPVKHSEVFFSKLLFLATIELKRSLTFVLPLLIAFGIVAGFGVGFYLLIPFFVILIALLPLLLAATISIPMTYLIQLLKKNSVIALSFFLVVMVLFAWGFGYFVSRLDIQISVWGAYRAIFEATMSFFVWTTNVLIVPRFISDLIFFQNVLVSLAVIFGTILFCLIVIILVVRPFYFKMAMLGSDNRPSRKKKQIKQIKTEKERGIYYVFFKKEGLIMLRSPNLLFTFFLFIFLMPFILFAANSLLNVIATRPIGDQIRIVANACLILLIAMSSNAYCATAISREGHAFYLTKTSPMSFRSQVYAKITMNAIIATPMILASCIVVFVLTGATWWQMSFVFVAASFINIGHMLWSFEIDLLRAKIGTLDESESGANNANVGTSVLIGLVLTVICTLFFGLNVFFEFQWLLWIKVLIFAILFAYIRYYLLDIKLHYNLNKLGG